MRTPICLEVGHDGWCTAWAAEWPGAHISRSSEAEAVAAMPDEIGAFLRFLRRFGEPVPAPRRVAVEVAERITLRAQLHHGATRALFATDRLPLTRADLHRQLRWLRHSRSMLLALVGGLPPDAFAWGTPGRKGRPPGKGGGGWTVELYLRHIAGVEKWYLQRFWTGLPRLPRAATVFERMAYTRRQVLQVVGRPRPEDFTRARKTGGELWTLRKVMRRLLYHERYHARTIARILLRESWPCPRWIQNALGLPALLER